MGDILRPTNLIPLSFIATIAAPVFLTIEMRYAITLQSFILGVMLIDNFIWLQFINIFGKVKKFFETRTFALLKATKVPYTMIIYILFIAFCFLLYGALLEISGSDPERILFRF